MADKARFYLEQSIPELQELEKKKIFTPDQIIAITKKRTDFEHRVNATGTTPADYTRYAAYEMNLESLRRKRCARLGIKSPTYSGQRRIFFILDRATRRFHGDLGLWMQYIEYARNERANKVLSKALSSVLKLHPAKPELWVFAARHAVEENADMAEARSHMQRGLRFNKGSQHMWLEYAKLELAFIAKVLARRRLLGIDGGVPTTTAEEGGEGVDDDASEDESGTIKLPPLTGSDFLNPRPKDHTLDTLALEDPTTNPALNGAIPLAIFDSATAQFPADPTLATSFFALFRSFSTLPCRGALLEHVVRHALDTTPTHAQALFLGVELPIIGVDTLSAAFPVRLRTVIDNMREAADKAVDKTTLCELFAACMLERVVEAGAEMDGGVKTAVLATVRKYCRRAEVEEGGSAVLYRRWAEAMVLRGKGGAVEVLQRGVVGFPGDGGLKDMLEGLDGVEGEGR